MKRRPVVDPCPFCGHNPCRPTGGKVASLPWVDAQAWKEIYWFIRYTQLPFIHQVLARAKERSDKTEKEHDE